MKQAFVLAAFAATLVAAPAQAQPVAADLLPAYEVNTIVASMGMRPIGRPAWMRGRYVVAAIDRYGRDVNVVLDARDGQVLAVQPIGRGRLGPPPPGYAGRPVPYDRMDERISPPAAIPAAPPADDGEFFDDDRQQGALPAPRPVARTTPPPRDPSVTGSVTRNTPTARRDTAGKEATPVPRPRPELARANDPGNTPAATPVAQPAPAAKPEQAKSGATQKSVQGEAKADVKPAVIKPDPSKTGASKTGAGKPANIKLEGSAPETMKPETKQARAPEQAAKPVPSSPERASKSDAPKPEVRVINLSKPKTAPKPEDKPGEAIRF